MIRAIVYWLFLKYVEKVEKGEDNDRKPALDAFRDSEYRLARYKAKLLELQELLRQKKAG